MCVKLGQWDRFLELGQVGEKRPGRCLAQEELCPEEVAAVGTWVFCSKPVCG